MDNHLSPAETAKRFGISIKALRLYEQHGLLKPLRAANGSTGRKARTKLASGAILSIDDLAALTQETAMTNQSTAEELKEILTPFKQKHLTPQEEASLEEASVKEWQSNDLARKSMRQLVEEAKALMTSGDATTAAAMDFARRFRATAEHLKSSEPPPLTALRPKLKAMMDDAQSDPNVSQKSEVFTFVGKALANLKAQEDNSASQE
jgi:hypothetical protein